MLRNAQHVRHLEPPEVALEDLLHERPWADLASRRPCYTACRPAARGPSTRSSSCRPWRAPLGWEESHDHVQGDDRPRQSEIREISPSRRGRWRPRRRGRSIDVREADEWAQGHVPGALFIPRGFLEPRIEEKVPDRRTEVILYCAGGTRARAGRAVAAGPRLHERLLDGGRLRQVEGGRRFPIEVPADASPPSRSSATAAISSCRRSARPGRRSCSRQRRCWWARAASAARPASTWPRPVSARIGVARLRRGGPRRTCSGRSCTRTTRSGKPKTESAASHAARPEPRRQGGPARPAARRQQHHGRDRALRRRSSTGRTTSARSTSSTTRRARQQAERLRFSIFRFDGQASAFVPRQGPLLPVPLPEPTPDGAGPFVRRGGRPRRPARASIGLMQATEAVKLILGRGRAAHRAGCSPTTRSPDDVPASTRSAAIPRCAVCGDHPTDPEGHRPRVVVPLRAASSRASVCVLSLAYRRPSSRPSWTRSATRPSLRLPPARRARRASELWGKCEWFNPGGSVKDRTALSHRHGGRARGALRPRAGRSSTRRPATPPWAWPSSAGPRATRSSWCMPGERERGAPGLCRRLRREDRVHRTRSSGSDGAIVGGAGERGRRSRPATSTPTSTAIRPTPRPLPDDGPRDLGADRRPRSPTSWPAWARAAPIVGTARYLHEREPARARWWRWSPTTSCTASKACKHLASAIVPEIYDPSAHDEKRDGRHRGRLRGVRGGPAATTACSWATPRGGAVGGARGRADSRPPGGDRRPAPRRRRALPERRARRVEDPRTRRRGRRSPRHARSGYPHEVCGVLLGTARDGAVRVASRGRPVANRETERPAVRYEIAPEDLMRRSAIAGARTTGSTSSGYYHSHPDHPARPSETDRRIAAEGLSGRRACTSSCGVAAGARVADGLGLPRRDPGLRRGTVRHRVTRIAKRTGTETGTETGTGAKEHVGARRRRAAIWRRARGFQGVASARRG